MSHAKFIGASAAVLITLAVPAYADVTAKQVWDNWRGLAERSGQTLTVGSTSEAGDGLVISGLTMSVDTPEVTVTGALDEVKFTERTDGTVLVTMSPRYTLTVEGKDAAEGRLVMAVMQEGLSIVASGDESSVAYDFKAASMKLVTEEVMAENDAFDMDLGMDIANAKGRYVVGGGETAPLSGTVAAESLSMKVLATDPGSDGRLEFLMDMAEISSNFSGVLMPLDPENMAAALAAGFAIDSRFEHGAATYKFDFTEGSDAFSMTASETGGHIGMAMSKDRLAYSIGDTGLQMTMSGSEIPLPEVSGSIGNLLIAISMPVSKSDEPDDLSMTVKLEDFAVSDMIWSMLDPGGSLPHDPATVILDVSGKANWAFDIMDPEAAGQMGDGMPGELHQLTLKQLRLAIAGAELTGVGAFIFDNADLATFGGVPKPTGAVDLTLVGGNGLLDKLVAMGLIPEDQAMGVRMMAGLFARPGDGEDTLTSKIEVTEDGAVMANGQRLQ